MSNLLPTLDLSYLGKPNAERQMLDKLGPFSKLDVISADYSNKKFKLFTIKYTGINGKYVIVDYKDQEGRVTVLKLEYVE